MADRIVTKYLYMIFVALGLSVYSDGHAEGVLPIGGVIKSVEDLNANYRLQSASDKNVRMVTDPVDATKPVLELTFNNNEVSKSTNKIYPRTEIVARNDMAKNDSGFYWYGFEFYLPSVPQIEAPDWVVLAQLHGSESVKGAEPAVSLWFRGDDLYLKLARSPNLVNSDTPPAKENTSVNNTIISKLKPNQWYRFIVRVYWSVDQSKGLLDIWLNDQLVTRERYAINTYDDDLGYNYAKQGIYAGLGLGSNSSFKVLARGIVLGDESANYEDIVTALSN